MAYIGFVLHCSKTVLHSHRRFDLSHLAAVLHRRSWSMTTRSKTIEAVAASEDTTANMAGKGFETTVAGLKDGMAQATAGFAETQAKVKAGMEKAMKTAEEMVAFGQGNVEALVKSGQIWATGMQDLGKQMAATAQASFEETMATFKAFSSVKSLKDAFDLQANLARSTMEKTLAESGKLTDASMKLTEQTLAPITARVSMAVEKFAKSA
ncbi:MAG TPA: phasin family protein [Acetobacteraceae bacterium]|nr:phasin family protein [Acetobacteraceae bacterium]